MAQLDPTSQIIRVQHAGPVDAGLQADLMLDSVAREDILHDKCQVPYAQLMPEFLGQFAGQRGSAWLGDFPRSSLQLEDPSVDTRGVTATLRRCLLISGTRFESCRTRERLTPRIAHHHKTIPSGIRQTAWPCSGALKP
jgi:hypothetical protein